MNTIHTLLLDLHSIGRWLIVLFGLYMLFIAGRGWLAQQDWTERAGRICKYFLILLDVQLLLGIILYFVFLSRQGGFEYVFGNPSSRFFLMEHSVMMIVAILVAHIGAYVVKRAAPAQKFKRLFIFYLISFILIFVSIPWPFMPGFGRPLLF